MLENSNNELIVESNATLNRIEKSKNYKKELYETIQESKDRFDIGRHFYEEYNELKFKTKMNIDLLFIEQLIQKLEHEQCLQVESLLVNLYNNVRMIYEFINIEPEIFGKFDEQLLNESEEVIKNKLSKKIYSFLENKYYNLPVSKREQKYSQLIQPLSKELISEGATIEEAVEYSIKQCLMEDLISNICFPFTIKNRLDYLMENEAYGEIFDQDKLKSIYESFKNNLENISKITAVCV